VYLADPATSIMSPHSVRILRTLSRATAPFTIRGLARVTGLPPSSTVRAVDRLAGAGLVTVQEAGRSQLCSLNRSHLAVPAVLELLNLREALLGAIQQEIKAWLIQPLHASVFGSFARGEGDDTSDLDVLVVRPDDIDQNVWAEQLHQSAQSLRAKSGNPVSWFDIGKEELQTATNQEEPIMSHWASDGILLAGASLSTVLSASRSAA
jgi:predicted nucleotidyltransferase